MNPVVPDTAVPDSSTTHPAPRAPEPVALAGDLIELARTAAAEEAGVDGVGDYLGAWFEDSVATSARFAATDRGYRGWYWLVTVAVVEATHPTISEVVLLPGEGALLAPAWVPWDQRVRAGDLGVGDLLPTPADDDRLVPGYLDSDDPAVREVDYEFGFGRARVLGRQGRDEAAQRWHDGPFGPSDPMAKQAPAACGTCGFYVRLEGLLGQAFGACGNEFSPADGRVVDAAYGCGAHSETVVDAPLISASTAAVMDEVTLEVHRRPAAGAPDAGGDPSVATQTDPESGAVGVEAIPAGAVTEPGPVVDAQFVADAGVVVEGATADDVAAEVIVEAAVAQTDTVVDDVDDSGATADAAAGKAVESEPAGTLATAGEPVEPPVAAESEPSATGFESSANGFESSATESEPSATESELSATESELSATESESSATESESSATEPGPAGSTDVALDVPRAEPVPQS